MLLYYIMMVDGKSVSHDNKAVIGQSFIIILSVYIIYEYYATMQNLLWHRVMLKIAMKCT